MIKGQRPNLVNERSEIVYFQMIASLIKLIKCSILPLPPFKLFSGITIQDILFSVFLNYEKVVQC